MYDLYSKKQIQASQVEAQKLDMTQEDQAYRLYFSGESFDRQYINDGINETIPGDLQSLARENWKESNRLKPEVLKGALEGEHDPNFTHADATVELLRTAAQYDHRRTERNRLNFVKKASEKRLKAARIADQAFRKMNDGGSHNTTKDHVKAIMLTAEAHKDYLRAISDDKEQEEFLLLCTEMKAYRQILNACRGDAATNMKLIKATSDKFVKCRQKISQTAYMQNRWKERRADSKARAAMNADIHKDAVKDFMPGVDGVQAFESEAEMQAAAQVEAFKQSLEEAEAAAAEAIMKEAEGDAGVMGNIARASMAHADDAPVYGDDEEVAAEAEIQGDQAYDDAAQAIMSEDQASAMKDMAAMDYGEEKVYADEIVSEMTTKEVEEQAKAYTERQAQIAKENLEAVLAAREAIQHMKGVTLGVHDEMPFDNPVGFFGLEVIGYMNFHGLTEVKYEEVLPHLQQLIENKELFPNGECSDFDDNGFLMNYGETVRVDDAYFERLKGAIEKQFLFRFPDNEDAPVYEMN